MPKGVSRHQYAQELRDWSKKSTPSKYKRRQAEECRNNQNQACYPDGEAERWQRNPLIRFTPGFNNRIVQWEKTCQRFIDYMYGNGKREKNPGHSPLSCPTHRRHESLDVQR